MLDTVVTLTFKEIKHILTLGGSASWSDSNTKAADCKYLVCTRNEQSKIYTGQRPHGLGFLIGRVSGIELTPEKSIPSQPDKVMDIDATRINICVSEYARIDIPNLRRIVRDNSSEADRNPVHYVRMSDLPINLNSLVWQPVPSRNQSAIDDYNRYHTTQRREENRRIDKLRF